MSYEDQNRFSSGRGGDGIWQLYTKSPKSYLAQVRIACTCYCSCPLLNNQHQLAPHCRKLASKVFTPPCPLYQP